MDDSLITLENLSVGYDNQPVLSGISLSLARAGYIALLGANGSGKSTLLKTLVGLLPPIAGHIHINAPADAPILFGYVPQSIQLDPLYPLTGFDVALMGVYGRIRPGHRVHQKERDFARECLHVTGAGEFSGQRFAELSGGQKQRVLIARALATKADVLVMDEPTAGVDAAATHALLEFISQLHEERQLTILIATHDLPLVRKHAHEVLWLHRGKMLYGPVAKILTPERMAEVLEMEIG